MPNVTFIEHDGTPHEVQARAGQSLMQAAVFNNIAGILADCGGNAACGTCNVYVSAPWAAILPPPERNEKAMIGLAAYPQPNSRLSCCITVTKALEGLTVSLPISQS